MAEPENKSPLSVIATTSDRLAALSIKNGQLIFIQDKHRIAMDFNGKRVFYNQITVLDSEPERTLLDKPVTGYYFVVSTAVLWSYNGGWIQLTKRPNDVVFIGTELPELGSASDTALYVNKSKKEICVYDKDSNGYIVVADKTSESLTPIESATEADIDGLF